MSLFLILLGLIGITTLFVATEYYNEANSKELYITVPIFKISLGIMAGIIATFLPIALGYKITAFSFILGIPGILFSLDFLAKWFRSKKKS